MAGVIHRVGPCPLVPMPDVDLFQALLRSIIYQQLHGKAAEAIHTRVLALMRDGSAAALQSLPDASLRAAGLSANKLLALRDLAARTLDATVPSAGTVAELSDDELIERLTKVRGVGPWTVHMLMIFYLGRPDVMPTGDFGIRKAFGLLYRRGRPVKPKRSFVIRSAGNRTAPPQAGIFGGRLILRGPDYTREGKRPRGAVLDIDRGSPGWKWISEKLFQITISH